MSRSVLISLQALAALALLAAAPAYAKKAEPIDYPPQPTGDVPHFPLDQVKPGMVGFTYTVMQGSKVVPIRTRILGVSANDLGPGLDMIVGILDDPKTALTGAVHGMSGSPLYLVDPKTGEWQLVGALSRRIAAFEKDAHCGFTPIKDMMAVEAKLKTAPVNGTLPQRSAAIARPTGTAQTASSSPLLRMLGMPVASATPPQAQTLGIPLTVSGLSTGAWQRIADLFGLDQSGFLPVQGGGNSLSASKLGPSDLVPGGPVAAVLMTGDVSMAGTGTLTWRQGNRMLGFGHAMMGLGAEAFGMGTAEIITVVPSYMRPFKMANQGQVVGTVTQDRFSAIGGFIGPKPLFSPYTIERIHNGEKRKPITGTWLPHYELTPEMIAMAIVSSLERSDDVSHTKSLSVSGAITFEDHQPLQLGGFYGGTGFDAIEAMFDAVAPLVMLYSQNYEKLTATGINLTLETTEKLREWNIESINTDRSQYEPGDTVRVNIELLEAYGGRTWKSLEIALPENLKTGGVTLRVASARALNEEDQFRRLYSSRNVDELITALNDRRQQDHFYLQAVTSAKGAVVGDQELPALPGTVRDVMGGGNNSENTVPLREQVWREVAETLPGIVRGSQEIEIELK